MTDLEDPSLVRPLIHNGYFRKRHGDTEFGKEGIHYGDAEHAEFGTT
jgi:hypothetical protein